MLKLLLSLLITLPAFAVETIILTDQNSVMFNSPVRSSYVAKKQLEVMEKSNKLPYSQPLYLILDTPGGSVTDGLLFIDTVKSLKRPVHTITIFAASMGYQIVQELGTRYILASGTLMSHRGAVGGLSGQVPGELNARLNYIQSMLTKMNVIAAKRIGMSLGDYQFAIINELWSFGQQAVDTKQADKVVNIVCDKDLVNKTYVDSISTPFGDIEVTYSSCPLITAPVQFGSNLSPQVKLKVEKEIEYQKRRVRLTY